MKLNHALVLTAALIITPLLRAGDLPAPLPEFMDQQQLAQWNANQTTATTTSAANEPSTQFYTGKPYVADAGGYIYKYRTYNPEMSRWTSADPSGFPDGVNNFVYASNPVSHGDSLGLFLSGTPYSGLTYDVGFWDASLGTAVALGWTITQEALGTAETGATSVGFSSADDAEIQGSNLYGEGSTTAGTVYNAIQNFENSSPGANFGPTMFSFGLSDPDELFGLAQLTFATVGTLTWSGDTWTYSATVNLTDLWSFASYGSGGVATPGDPPWDAVGYRLQSHGYISPNGFSISGSFTDTWTGTSE